MSQEPLDPSHPSSDETESAPHREAFVVRVWRFPAEDAWRCRLIHVETGHHLPCDHPSQIVDQIEAWLARAAGGLR